MIVKKIIAATKSQSKYSFIINLIFSLSIAALEAISLTAIIPLLLMIIDPKNKHIEFLKIIFANNNLIVINFNFTLFLFIGLVFFLRFFITTVASYQLANYRMKIQEHFSKKSLFNFLSSKYIEFKKKNSTDLITFVNKETEIFSTCVDSLIKIISEIFVILIIVAALLWQNAKFTIVIVFFTLVVSFYFSFFFKKKIHEWGEIRRKSDQNRLLRLKEIFQFFKEIVVFKKQQEFIHRYEYFNHKTQVAQRNRIFTGTITRGLIELVVTLLLLLSIAYLTLSSTDKTQYHNFLIFFFIGVVRIFPSVSKIIQGIQLINFSNEIINQHYFLAKRHMKKIKILKKKKPNFFKNGTNKNILKISRLSFGYPDGVLVFNNINIEAKDGDIIGVTGESGKGKSTFAEILLGLMKPVSGTIKFNGKNIYSHIDDWLDLSSYVSQQNQVISGSIYDNIALGFFTSQKQKEKINSLIYKLNRNLFLRIKKRMNLPAISDGKNLSGGEIQRISIARAIYKNPKILILDEFTSSIDFINEKEILEEISKLSKGRIIFIISHKKSTLSICNKIYEIKKSRPKKINE